MAILKWVLAIIIPIILIVGILFYFSYGLKDASLEKFEITEIKDVTSNSFILTGNLHVKNPSDISVPIDSVDYDIILKETGEVISSGKINSFILERNAVTKIPFNQKVEWVPTTKFALDIITKEQVFIIVKGNIKINLPQVKEHAIPFSKEIDIKEQIKQFMNNKNQEPLKSEESNVPLKGII